jgi:hypothetical protein
MNTEKINTNQSEDDSKRLWDLLNPENDARLNASRANDVQAAFGRRVQRLSSEETKMSQKEFDRWEDEYTEYIDKTEEKTNETNPNYAKYCEVMAGIITYPGGGREKDLHNTIEAQAGNYYFDRKNALAQAINDSDESEEKKKAELAKIDEFVYAVYEHIDFKYMGRDEQLDYGPERYDAERTKVHNKAIRCLNAINDLAEKYDTRPFTPRNFNPSDTVPRNSQTQSEALLFRYDRDIVEEYYAIAFAEKEQQARAKLERNLRYGIV